MSATIHSLPGYRYSRNNAIARANNTLLITERGRYSRPVMDLDVAWGLYEDMAGTVDHLPEFLILRLMTKCRTVLKERGQCNEKISD